MTYTIDYSRPIETIARSADGKFVLTVGNNREVCQLEHDVNDIIHSPDVKLPRQSGRLLPLSPDWPKQWRAKGNVQGTGYDVRRSAPNVRPQWVGTLPPRDYTAGSNHRHLVLPCARNHLKYDRQGHVLLSPPVWPGEDTEAHPTAAQRNTGRYVNPPRELQHLDSPVSQRHSVAVGNEGREGVEGGRRGQAALPLSDGALVANTVKTYLTSSPDETSGVTRTLQVSDISSVVPSSANRSAPSHVVSDSSLAFEVSSIKRSSLMDRFKVDDEDEDEDDLEDAWSPVIGRYDMHPPRQHIPRGAHELPSPPQTPRCPKSPPGGSVGYSPEQLRYTRDHLDRAVNQIRRSRSVTRQPVLNSSREPRSRSAPFLGTPASSCLHDGADELFGANRSTYLTSPYKQHQSPHVAVYERDATPTSPVHGGVGRLPSGEISTPELGVPIQVDTEPYPYVYRDLFDTSVAPFKDFGDTNPCGSVSSSGRGSGYGGEGGSRGHTCNPNTLDPEQPSPGDSRSSGLGSGSRDTSRSTATPTGGGWRNSRPDVGRAEENQHYLDTENTPAAKTVDSDAFSSAIDLPGDNQGGERSTDVYDFDALESGLMEALRRFDMQQFMSYEGQSDDVAKTMGQPYCYGGYVPRGYHGNDQRSAQLRPENQVFRNPCLDNYNVGAVGRVDGVESEV